MPERSGLSGDTGLTAFVAAARKGSEPGPLWPVAAKKYRALSGPGWEQIEARLGFGRFAGQEASADEEDASR